MSSPKNIIAEILNITPERSVASSAKGGDPSSFYMQTAKKDFDRGIIVHSEKAVKGATITRSDRGSENEGRGLTRYGFDRSTSKQGLGSIDGTSPLSRHTASIDSAQRSRGSMEYESEQKKK